ncbi:uncharacterized protein BJ212DRAFT_1570233 [Suillus subaureus]|uniref:Dihydroneopterin aldolase/epimerase domain-containing protein n=1 Tax=Suillus subaureus TaxID=48587 RepID=A0A9P7E293_9AGAM|nr:uncharacterized protein BJ212DRAFT_1570233 [Suillus subaureus]KAG1809086.1 hypothetical protein BJ212DRAFT_1570233 [Suillus subaureus]
MALSHDPELRAYGKQIAGDAHAVSITVHFYLKPAFPEISGQSDNVVDSIHYGRLISAPSASFAGVRGLVHKVTQKVFALARECILLANNFEVEVIIHRGIDSLQQAAEVSFKDLVVPVLLVWCQSPKRLAKQKLITDHDGDHGYTAPMNITFYRKSCMHQVDYLAIIKQIFELSSSQIEHTAYLTLEKLVLHIVRSTITVTTRSQKPSALSFAHSSGIEITRLSLSSTFTPPRTWFLDRSSITRH